MTTRPTLFATSENYHPEAIVPLKGGAIPVSLSSPAGGDRGDMNIKLSLDLKGANGDEEIARIAREQSIAGITTVLRHYDAQLPSRLRDIERRGQ